MFIAVYENMNICVVRPPTLGSQRQGTMRMTVRMRAGTGSFFPGVPHPKMSMYGISLSRATVWRMRLAPTTLDKEAPNRVIMTPIHTSIGYLQAWCDA